MESSRFAAPGTRELPATDAEHDNKEPQGTDSPDNGGAHSRSHRPLAALEPEISPHAAHATHVSSPAASQFGGTTPPGPSGQRAYEHPAGSAHVHHPGSRNGTQSRYVAASQFGGEADSMGTQVGQPAMSQFGGAASHAGSIMAPFAQPSAMSAQTGAPPRLSVNGAGSLPRPLRVVHVGELMVRAGIEVWLKGLIRHANPERMRFTRCVVTSNHVDHQFAAEIGAPVEIGGPESARRAARDCDVMMISGPKQLGTWLAEARPKVCISVAHGSSWCTREIIEGCGPLVDHVVAVSPRVQQLVCGGFQSSVIYNGVDAVHVSTSRPRHVVREALGFAPDDFVIGYVGRFSQEKRLDTILEAIATLPKQFKVLFVGWGPWYPDLLHLANRLIPMRYAFAEATDHLGDYYQAMDAFCLASESEGFGLATMEAMMCDRPVVVTPVGFVPEAIEDRVNGVLVDGDAESIRQAMLLLQRHPEWARSIAREGRQYAEEYGHAFQMARQYESLFERLWREKFAA